jgi:hypothetical protein
VVSEDTINSNETKKSTRRRARNTDDIPSLPLPTTAESTSKKAIVVAAKKKKALAVSVGVAIDDDHADVVDAAPGSPHSQSSLLRSASRSPARSKRRTNNNNESDGDDDSGSSLSPPMPMSVLHGQLVAYDGRILSPSSLSSSSSDSDSMLSGSLSPRRNLLFTFHEARVMRAGLLKVNHICPHYIPSHNNMVWFH